jgi:hypothetical protein
MNGRYQLAGITGYDDRWADTGRDGFAARASLDRRTIAAVRAVAATREPGRSPGGPAETPRPDRPGRLWPAEGGAAVRDQGIGVSGLRSPAMAAGALRRSQNVSASPAAACSRPPGPPVTASAGP